MTPHYEIRLQGELDPGWSEWFDGLTLSPPALGETVLSGPIRDQAALHGLLGKVRDLGLKLIAVNEVQPEDPDRRQGEIEGERDSNREAL